MGWFLHISRWREATAVRLDKASPTKIEASRRRRFLRKISNVMRLKPGRRQHASLSDPDSDSTLTADDDVKQVAIVLERTSLEGWTNAFERINGQRSGPLEESVPTAGAVASPDQKVFLFDLPMEILLLICEQLSLKPAPIGCPDDDDEVPKTLFMTEYRHYRTLNFSLVSRRASALINMVFFGLNTFEFHHATDFERLALGLSDSQRDLIRRLRYYSATTQPFSQTPIIEAPSPATGARHFPVLTDAELAAAGRSFQNALALAKTCNRLFSLEIFYRYQIHAESLYRPHSVTWEGKWTRHLLLPTTPPVFEQLARWDYVHSGALECLRGVDEEKEEEEKKKQGTTSFDFDEPIANELADRIDRFITENDIDVETYQVEPDCNEILSEVVKAREQSIVRDVDGAILCEIRELACVCCGIKLWKRVPKGGVLDDGLSIYCGDCVNWKCPRGCNFPRTADKSAWTDEKRAGRLARIDKVRFKRRVEDIEDDETPEDVFCSSAWLLENIAGENWTFLSGEA